MSTSGTTTFVPVFDELIVEAWERLGKSPAILSGEVARAARRSMQYMLIDWSNRTPNLWQIDRRDRTLVVGVMSVPVPDGTADVLDLWIKGVDGSDMKLFPVSRDEFAGLPRKDQRGRPSQYWVERRRDTPVIHLWPVPDRAYVLSINRLRVPEDVGALSDSPDAPVLWAEAMASGLAARLAVKYAPDRVTLLKQEAAEAYAAANSEERERVALTILPEVGWNW